MGVNGLGGMGMGFNGGPGGLNMGLGMSELVKNALLRCCSADAD